MANSVSVCIIAKNEEKYIETCLQALAPTGLEVVVVDTGSTDRTKEIAAKYTKSVYDYEWCNDFSKARNFAVSMAKNDYILSLDCDEFIETLSVNSIVDFLKKNPRGIGRIKLTNFLKSGTGVGKSTEYMARVFNRKFVHFEDSIHEQLRTKDKSPFVMQTLDVSVLHMGYLQDDEALKRKYQRNVDLLLKQAEERPDDPYTFFHLGTAYFNIDDKENAYKYRKKAMELNPPKHEEYTRILVSSYANSCMELGKFDEALQIEEYFDYMYESADYMFVLGKLYSCLGRIDDAIMAFNLAMEGKYVYLEGANSYFPLHALGVLYESIGEKEKAEECENRAQQFLREKYNS